MGRKHPSEKQIIATQLIAKGMKPSKAMLKAGYSKYTSNNPKENLLMSSTIVPIIDKMKIKLESDGITGEYLAGKLGTFAQSDNPKTFFQAYDRIKDVVGINPTMKSEEGIKREFTFTEWVRSIPDQVKEKGAVTEGEIV